MENNKDMVEVKRLLDKINMSAVTGHITLDKYRKFLLGLKENLPHHFRIQEVEPDLTCELCGQDLSVCKC